jgi:hypothetical protein
MVPPFGVLIVESSPLRNPVATGSFERPRRVGRTLVLLFSFRFHHRLHRRADALQPTDDQCAGYPRRTPRTPAAPPGWPQRTIFQNIGESLPFVPILLVLLVLSMIAKTENFK